MSKMNLIVPVFRDPSNASGHEERKVRRPFIKSHAFRLPFGQSWLDTSSPITHTGGTNVYTVKLRDTWPEVVFAATEPRDDAGNGQYCSTGTISNEASTTQLPITFKFQTFNASGAVQNDSNLTVSCAVAIRETSANYGN